MGGATGPRYHVDFRRRREQRTDYRKRLALVKSRLPRLVIRASNKAITTQVIVFNPTGDRVVVSASSRELTKYHWPAMKNVPTAYLTGLLVGVKAKKQGIGDVVPDVGRGRITKSSAYVAALKGAKDAGLSFSFDDALVSEERIRGEHIAAYEGTKVYAGSAIARKDLPALFEKVKKVIIDGH